MFIRNLTLGSLLLSTSWAHALEKKSSLLLPRVEKLLSLCNAWDLTGLTKTLNKQISPAVLNHIPADEIAEHMLQQCLDHGRFEIKSTSSPSPRIILVTLLGKKSGMESELSLSENDQGKFEMPSLDPKPLQGWSPPQDLSDASLVQTVQSEVKRLSESGLFSGTVVIARGSTILVAESMGYAHRARKTKFTSSSQFTLASLSKIFTAVAVGQLVDQKKLSFDDKVEAFFPDYPNKVVRTQATVGMLLAHLAGMGDILDKRPDSMLKDGWLRAETFVPLTALDELQFTPGTRQGYSNAGLALAGAIVEKAAGIDYPTYLRERLFKVNGMMDSDPNNIPFKGPQLVTPYTRQGSNFKPDHWLVAPADLGSPAGGAISTAHDLVKFADALRNGKIISRSTLDQMKKPAFESEGSFAYGYGMSTETIEGQEWIGHNGGFAGVSTELSLMTNGPYTLVILENRDPPATEWLGQRFRSLLSGKAKKESSSTQE